MVKVPIWEQNVSDLPGASNTPHATPNAFGAQIGEAQAFAGKAIGQGISQMGEALAANANEQGAIASKSALSDHETAVGQYELKLDRDLPADQASAKPQMLRDFAANDWNERRGSIYGRNLPQADATVHNYHNRKGLQWDAEAVKTNDIYVEKQIDGSAEKQSALLQQNPGNLPQALDTTKSLVAETNRNDLAKRDLLIKYGRQYYDAINKGYEARALQNPLDEKVLQEWDDFKKTGKDTIARGLGVTTLPETPLGGVNSKRVSDIDKTPLGKIADDAAAKNGVDPGVLKATISIESNGNPNAVTGNNKGATQLSDDLFTKYGRPGGNIFDANDNVFATARKMADENARFKTAMGRDPTPTEQYLIHQQGYAGAAAHMANPDGVAWQNVRRFYKSDEIAKSAIWGNLSQADKKAFGNDVNNVTSRAFVATWSSKVTGEAGGPAAAVVDPAFFTSRAVVGKDGKPSELYVDKVNPVFASRLAAGIKAAEDATGSKITINEMGRTTETQAKYRAKYEAGTGGLAAKPGQSRHEHEQRAGGAEAADLNYSPAREWLRQHAAEFGLEHLGGSDMPHFQLARSAGGTPTQSLVVRGREGLTVPGNIDVSKQPQVKNADGSISTVRSMSIGTDQGTVLIPTVAHDGSRVLSDRAAVEQYNASGRHLGIFDNSAAADDFAERLHQSEARALAAKQQGVTEQQPVTGQQPLGGTGGFKAPGVVGASPMLGQTPHEFQKDEEHWDSRMKAVRAQAEAYRKTARTTADATLTQEEMSVKTHGAAGVDPSLTPEALAMIFGATEAEKRLAAREANLKYHANTRWGEDTTPEQMAADLRNLSPDNVNPQDAAFTQHVKNFEEASKLAVKINEINEKRMHKLGDEATKGIMDAAFAGKAVTTDMIDASKKWMSPTQLQTAYTLRDKPPVREDAGVLMSLDEDVRNQPPDEFRKTLEAHIRNRNLDAGQAGEWARRNGDIFRAGTKTPVERVRAYIHEKLTPGVAGEEGMDARNRMADALREFDLWVRDPANKPVIGSDAAVDAKGDEIIKRAADDQSNAVRDRLVFSRYFDNGATGKGRRDINEDDINRAQAKLDSDVVKMSEGRGGNIADMNQQQNLLNQWRSTLKIEQKLKADTAAKKAQQSNPAAPKTAPANPLAPQKMGATIAPQPLPPMGRPSGDQIEVPPPTGTTNPDRLAIQPQDVMQQRTRTDLQENI